MECGYGKMSKNSTHRRDYKEFRTDSIEFNARRYGVSLRRDDTSLMPHTNFTNNTVNQYDQNGSAFKNDDIKQNPDNTLLTNGWIDSNTVMKNFNLTKNLFKKCISILELETQDLRLLKYNLKNGTNAVTYLSPRAVSLLDNLLNRNQDWFTIK